MLLPSLPLLACLLSSQGGTRSHENPTKGTCQASISLDWRVQRCVVTSYFLHLGEARHSMCKVCSRHSPGKTCIPHKPHLGTQGSQWTLLHGGGRCQQTGILTQVELTVRVLGNGSWTFSENEWQRQTWQKHIKLPKKEL